MCQVCRRKDKCQVYQRKDHIEGSDSRSIQRRMSIGQLGFFFTCWVSRKLWSTRSPERKGVDPLIVCSNLGKPVRAATYCLSTEGG